MCGIARLQATQEVFADDERWAGLSPVDLVRAAVAETVAISLRHERYLRAVVLVSAAHAGVRRRGSRYRQALGEEFAGVVLRSRDATRHDDPEVAVRSCPRRSMTTRSPPTWARRRCATCWATSPADPAWR